MKSASKREEIHRNAIDIGYRTHTKHRTELKMKSNTPKVI